jgi:diguanylate cyclase (GGDEF)-like protein/PAS domain S-box-containing protein
MIRFATPIKDKNNQNNGILILNYFGQIILDKFLEAKKGFTDNILLLNSDGYYIIGHNKDQEWSFMFPDKKYGHFAIDFPKIWQQIQSNKQNFYQSSDGIFFHDYIKPNIFLKDAKQKECINCTFVMVAFQSHKQFAVLKNNYINEILPTIIITNLILIFSLWIAYNYYKKSKLIKKKLSDMYSSIVGERDVFVGGPTIVFKWFNRFGWPVEYVSANVKNVLGYQPQQFMNQQLNLSSIIVPEHRQQVIDNLNNAKKQGNDWLELDAFQIVTHSGQRRWTHGTVTFIKDESGQINRFFGYFNDISILKEIESQLVRTNDYIQTVINTIADPTLVINVEDFSIKLSNQAANQLYLGNPICDVSHITCYQLSHKRDLPCSGEEEPCPLIKILKTAKKTKVIHTHYNQQGEELFVEVVATPIFDEFNQVCQIIESHRDITHHVNREQKLQKLAITDTLTQCYNRLKFDQELEKQILLAHKSDNYFALIMLDIDHFKLVNDQFGHDIGDDILKKFVMIIHSHIRKGDILARWGGEEFMLLVPLSDIQTAERIAELLRKVIASYDFGIDRLITSSFGVTYLSSVDSCSSITKRVDNALYQSKQNGRNCITVLEVNN